MTAAAPVVADDPIQKLQAALSEAERVRAEAEADLVALDREGEAAVAALASIDQRVAASPLQGPALTRARNRRRKLRDAMEDGATDRYIFERRVTEARLREKEANVALHHALRVGIHDEGIQVAQELRDLVGQIEDLFTKWSALSEADRRSCDVLRSLSPEAMNRLPTFGWATATDGHMTEAIAQLVALKRRAEADLKQRAEAAKEKR
jgi:hypothetical protein